MQPAPRLYQPVAVMTIVYIRLQLKFIATVGYGPYGDIALDYIRVDLSMRDCDGETAASSHCALWSAAELLVSSLFNALSFSKGLCEGVRGGGGGGLGMCWGEVMPNKMKRYWNGWLDCKIAATFARGEHQ